MTFARSWKKPSKEVGLVSDIIHGLTGGPSTDAWHVGVTIVQYREKKSDTGDQIRTARKLHQITRRYNVPLVINDRVDVALAAGVEGVHLGQDDMGTVASV